MSLFSWFNPAWLAANFFTFWTGGGGGGGTTKSTVTQSNLPAYAQPYYQELLKQTGKEVFQTDASGKVIGMKSSDNMPQQTVAGFTPEQLAAFQNVGALQTPEEFNQAQAGMTAALGQGQQYGQRGLDVALAYDPTTRTFGQDYYNQYANPYQQNVINTALREAQLKAAMDRNAAMRQSIGKGTFGGARQALLQAEADRNTMQTLGDIQYKGMADAWKAAQEQFNTEEARRQQALQYQAGLGKDIGLGGLNLQSEMSKALGALGSARQEANLARLKAQEAVGTTKQAQAQREADTQYQNAMAKYNYAKQQLQFYSDILQGNANALGSSQVTYTPAPSMISQVGGLGLAGLGLANVMGKG